MRVIVSSQYISNCVVAEDGDNVERVLDLCWKTGAVRTVDGVEFVVQLRQEVGPELWTEDALRSSLSS